MDIPGLSTLYSILKRHIEHGNDTLDRRKQLAEELRQNCQKWTVLLENMLKLVAANIADSDYRAAEKAITELLDDFVQVDYKYLRQESPILLHLSKDPRFNAFADSCADFYNSALNLKRLVYKSIPDTSGTDVKLRTHGLSMVRRTWKSELERMLDRVDHEYMKVKVLEPS